MNLESPEGHFTDEKIQKLYNGTHLKGKHQPYESNSSSNLPSPIEINSDYHSQKSIDKSVESSDSDSFSGNSNKTTIIKEIFQKMKEKTAMSELKQENAKLVSILKSSSNYQGDQKETPSLTFNYEPTHPAIVKNQMQMAHILQKCSILSEEKYEITGSTLQKNEKPALTSSLSTASSILDNKLDKIDPYKYLFAANPVAAKSVLQ